MNSPAIKVENNGANWGVWELYGANYNGPDWIVPLYKQVAEFENKEEAEAFAIMIPIPIPDPPF